MGAKQSKLKKEIAALKSEASASAAKHAQDVETLRNEKRMLEFKLQALQEMTAKAQVEAETATQLAVEHEQRAKALKWKLVRRLSVPAAGTSPASTLTASTSSSVSSLASGGSDPASSVIPRVPVSWKLKKGTTLRRSNTSINAKRPTPEREASSDLFKASVASGGKETGGQRVPLAKPNPQTKPHDTPNVRTVKPPASNQDDATVPQPVKPVVSAPAQTPPAVATPVVTTSAAAPAAAAPDFDIFAPVKRRSSTRDSIVTIASSSSADAKADTSERVDSFKRSTGPAKDSNSDSEPSRSSESSSQSKEDATRSGGGGKSRGVHASTKGRGPSESKTDDVLALSDDEED